MVDNNSAVFNKSREAYDIKEDREQFEIILAGNPNVGKSTVFNALTGMKQHTGNWAGKTVSSAIGIHKYGGDIYKLTDTPGIYSLSGEIAEEKYAGDQIYLGEYDGIIVVCDATHLERNLSLVLQCMEVSCNVVLCINLIDEAEKNNIEIDTDKLRKILGIQVCAVSARSKRGLDELIEKTKLTVNGVNEAPAYKVKYSEEIEAAISILTAEVEKHMISKGMSSRLVCLILLSGDYELIEEMQTAGKIKLNSTDSFNAAIQNARESLQNAGLEAEAVKAEAAKALAYSAAYIAGQCVKDGGKSYFNKYDKILTGKFSGAMLMAGLLFVVLWITISGANYPSYFLMENLLGIENELYERLMSLGLPAVAGEMLVFGVYRVMAWVVSVMLPPMAIFFPLFTLLEDAGYLPRVAFNLDKYFNKCRACGRQALTMCMGFGCNSVGVSGCRIIDSTRERLIAIITNSFVPCNGRFPILLAVINIYFVSADTAFSSAKAAMLLFMVILTGVMMTFLVSWILSKTVLSGESSAFVIEMPAIRRPQLGKTIIRSVFDRTFFVLMRAVAVAAPAGLIIWLLVNLRLGGMPLLGQAADLLDPAGRLMGMDGAILLAFILGFPANEIVIPIMIMIYTATGSMVDAGSAEGLRNIFEANGWTAVTACSTMLFTLFHWPCSTTLLTIKKETAGSKWTFVSFIVPTACGVALCMIFRFITAIAGVR